MMALFGGALIAGLLTALGSALVSRLTRVKEDAAFGSIFIVLFALGIALVSVIPTQINLQHFLLGNILSASPADIWLATGTTGITVLVFLVFRRSIQMHTFDPVFHRATGGHGGLLHSVLLVLLVLNLIASLQAMGVLLALGLFLLPAVTAYLWCESLGRMMILSSLCAVTCSAVGILVSYHVGIASGASIVLCLGALFLFSAIVSPRHGIIARMWQQRAAGRGVIQSQE
jgi:zinc/manganese transport system permease protein